MDNCPLLIESICIKDQNIQLLDYHNKRANSARRALCGSSDKLDFSEFIDITKAIDPIVKCRIIYDHKIKSIEYHSYSLRPINSLQIIDVDDDWCYKNKYLDRSMLDHYYSQRGKADDMVMIQNGYVTDSYYGNLAFLKDGLWYTPEKPLLKGTKRASLIDDNQIIECQISKEEIQSYESVRIFNAMIEFGQIEISPDLLYD